MRSISKWKKTVLLSCTAGVLTFAGIADQNAVTVWAAPSSGVCMTDNVVVRESAVDGAMVGGLSEGQEVTIQDETQGEDGKTWYEITYEVNGSERTGWVRSDLIDTAGDTTAEPDEDQDNPSIQLETGTGNVTLTNIPEEESAKLSDRFVQSVCEFEEGSVTAYQLSTADDLVAEDASLVDFYYVYGTNELGVSGWYVYDANEGTIQRNLSNMQYEIPAEPEKDAVSETGFEMDSISEMLIGVLAVVCLLLLVLAIIFSIRYRRLRRLLEEETEDDEDDDAAQLQNRAEPKERRRKEKIERGRTEKEGHTHNSTKPKKEKKSREKDDLENYNRLDDEEPDDPVEEDITLESLLSRGGKKQTLPQNDSDVDIFNLFDKEFQDESDAEQELEKRELERELEDLERILSREFSSQNAEEPVDEEPEYYDDDDDDLEFL